MATVAEEGPGEIYMVTKTTSKKDPLKMRFTNCSAGEAYSIHGAIFAKLIIGIGSCLGLLSTKPQKQRRKKRAAAKGRSDRVDTMWGMM